MKKWKRNLLIGLSINVVAVLALVLAWPSISLHIMDGHFLREGIEKYNPAVSSVSLCKALTARYEDDRHDRVLFVDQFHYEDSFFRFEEFYDGGYAHETVVLALRYSKPMFEEAYGDVRSQSGFLPETVFCYGDFEFHLNEAYTLYNRERGFNDGSDYLLSGNSPYLHWINIIGISNSRCELAFVGFYHVLQWRSGLWTFDESYYPFAGWSNLFEKEFSFFDWKV